MGSVLFYDLTPWYRTCAVSSLMPCKRPQSLAVGVPLISFRDRDLEMFMCLSPRENGDIKMAGADPRVNSIVSTALKKSLEKPLHDFYARPRKEFRAQLLRIGYSLFQPAGEISADDLHNLERASEAIEALHTGSLIVDDIEDQSEWRRGAPTLHLTYGMPTALNAGNWLYFYAFERLRQVQFTGARASDRKLMLYELTESVLREAHCGQALDVGTDMGDLQIQDCGEICRASLELKSGALMALALGLGAIVAGVDAAKLKVLIRRGLDFGVSLQMFDDLGNARVDQPTPKHLEDLKLRRPSFLWWHCAEDQPGEFAAFNDAVKCLPDVTPLADFFKRTDLLGTGRLRAQEFKVRALEQFKTELQPEGAAFQKLCAIAERVSNAYT